MTTEVTGQETVLTSEFAHVAVSVDHAANGPRLLVRDLRSGRSCHLDPLELESLACARHEDLRALLDPGATRWMAD